MCIRDRGCPVGQGDERSTFPDEDVEFERVLVEEPNLRSPGTTGFLQMLVRDFCRIELLSIAHVLRTEELRVRIRHEELPELSL